MAGTPPSGPQGAAPDDARRLSIVVAALARCSRRVAEQYITEGWVSVDGRRADLPQQRVSASQRVEIDARAQLSAPVPVTFLFHKPHDVSSDAAMDSLVEACHWRDDRSGIRAGPARRIGVQSLLALPPQASGLCVYSQDRRVIRKLTEDAAYVEQELVAEVRGEIAADGLSRLCHGLVRDGQALPAARVSWQSETRLRFAMKGIPPETIAWMCARVGLELLALRRLRIGRIPMAGLPPGQWRYLAEGERF